MTTYSGRDFWEANPPRWPTVQVKSVARLGTGHTPSRSHPEYWEDCTIPWVTTEDLTSRYGSGLQPLHDTRQKVSKLGLANSAAVLHPVGTVMLSRTASIGHSVIIGQSMATTQAFVTWTCGPKLEPRYLLAALKAMGPEFERLAYGSTHLTIYMPDLEQLRVPLPPLAEQRAVADFLDAETARIDALIAKKQQLLASLLQRVRSATHAAVSGLDVAGPRRAVDLGWTDDLPVSWDVVPLKRVAWLSTGHTPSRSRPELWTDCYIPWISLFDVGRMRDWSQTTLQDTAQHISDAGIANSSARLLPAGTVVLSRTASVGFSTVMGQDMAVSQHFVTWTPRPELDAHYLLHVLRAMEQVWRSLEVGTTNVTVFMPDLEAVRIPLPPLAIQKEVVQRLESEVSRIAGLRTRIERQIVLLQERRQALITAAVTGQLAVPGVAV